LSAVLQCSRHEAIGLLICLWLWAIHNADRDGLILNATEDDIAEGVMYRGMSTGQSDGQSHGTSAKRLVECLIETGWIDADRENQRFLLHDWDEWQDMWYKACARRVSDTKRKRKERAEAKLSAGLSQGLSQGLSTHNHTVTTPVINNVDFEEKPRKRSKKELNEFFEAVWRQYPKKEGKGSVSDAQKAKLYDIGFDELSRCIERFKCAKSGIDKKYWIIGSTFFNSGYVDYLDANYSSGEPNETPAEFHIDSGPLDSPDYWGDSA